MEACRKCHIPTVETCLKASDEVLKLIINRRDNQGETPLHAACASGSPGLLKILLGTQAKKDINRRNYYGKTPLHLACKSGSTVLVKLLLGTKAKKNINHVDSEGGTPLHLACESGRVSLVKLLLGTRAEKTINHQNRMGYTPLDMACQSETGTSDLIDLLLKAGACPNQMLGHIFQEDRGSDASHEDSDSDDVEEDSYEEELKEENERCYSKVCFPESTRWHRRSPWLHALEIAAFKEPVLSPSVACGGAGSEPESVMGDVQALLTDRRLVRVDRDSKLIYSLIVGTAVQFLSACCEEEECPSNQPF